MKAFYLTVKILNQVFPCLNLPCPEGENVLSEHAHTHTHTTHTHTHAYIHTHTHIHTCAHTHDIVPQPRHYALFTNILNGHLR